MTKKQKVQNAERGAQLQGKAQPSQGVFEIAILAQVKWNLHSLNNEGTIGNVTEPRTIVLWDGTKTDGVSGEMMKHIHAYWTWLQAKTGEDIPLCPACQSFQPQRADAAPQGLDENEANAMTTAIERCVLCDLHGFLVQRPTIHRQSVVEFGWIVGLPGKVHRDIHVHARHAIAQRGVSAAAESGETEVAAQMLYHRPTRSGVYALVTLFQPWRIGLNEVNYTYALDDNERARRYKLALTAYEWTLKRPDGAMTSTRFPHIEGIEGIVLISRQAVPVPMLSPLRDDYQEKLRLLAEKQGIEAKEFKDLDELLGILSELRSNTPFRMPFPGVPSAGGSAPGKENFGQKGGGGRHKVIEGQEESIETSSDSPTGTE